MVGGKERDRAGERGKGLEETSKSSDLISFEEGQPGRRPRVLIVEDEKDLVELIEMSVNNGLNTLCVVTDNVETTLEMTQAAMADKDPFDIIICDLGIHQTPRGGHSSKGGFEIAKKIRNKPELYGEPLFILFSADADNVSRLYPDEELFEMGVHQVLMKDFRGVEALPDNVINKYKQLKTTDETTVRNG